MEDARAVFAALDVWTARAVRSIAAFPGDIVAAPTLPHSCDLPRRTPDAIDIAAAARVECSLITFDRKVADNATALRVPVAVG